uniref:uncharacterized protein LOC113474061 n=1 Tax=Ciona intestinalis TaxID=7719 RepID=UPI000180BD1F|nr:uncharacterized protein LOC113474061 [Ciona intestinalis]|eukprot:XP_026690853.1 uncharacterized protein LOC113474061 [Ciona intestinalis]
MRITVPVRILRFAVGRNHLSRLLIYKQHAYRSFSLSSLHEVQENENYSDFSKSVSHPSKASLADHVGDMSYSEDEGYKLSNILGLSVAFLGCMLVGYAIFFSNYDLELEEKLCETVPGYRDEMSKRPGYVKNIELLQEKRRNEKLSRNN